MEKSGALSILLLALLLASTFLDSANTFMNEPIHDRGRSRYGQNCSSTIKCVTASWLSCQNNTCQCFRPNEMKYDETTRKCVSLTGERCRLGINQGSDSDDLIIYARTGCDANAYCNREGICACNKAFFETSSGSCNPKLGYLKSCNSESDIECLTNQGLSCQDKQCRCEDLKSVYLEAENQCVGLGGQPCINSKCSQHSDCSVENICECQNDFYLNSEDGVCLPKIGPLENCTEDAQCRQIGSQPLVCLDGVCNCDPAKSVYAIARVSVHIDDTRDYNEFQGFEDPELTQCAGLVDSECVDRLCVPNAFCSYYAPFSERTTTTTPSPDRYYQNTDNYDYDSSSKYEKSDGGINNNSGTCKCTSGYTKTKSHRCAVALNFACDYTSDCADGLICQNLECVCPYNIEHYEEAKGTCVSQIGGPCDPSPDNPPLSCGENAYCKAINSTSKNPGQKIAGHCVCQNGRIEDAEGNCIPGYGGSCRVTSECNSIAQLVCIDRKCACPAFQEYNASWRKCVGLVGAKCNSDQEKECTDNAQCAPWYQKQLQGSCACNKGFEENHDYTCDPVADAGFRIIVADDAEL